MVGNPIDISENLKYDFFILFCTHHRGEKHARAGNQVVVNQSTVNKKAFQFLRKDEYLKTHRKAYTIYVLIVDLFGLFLYLYY